LKEGQAWSGSQALLDEARTVYPNLDAEQRYLLVEASNPELFAGASIKMGQLGIDPRSLCASVPGYELQAPRSSSFLHPLRSTPRTALGVNFHPPTATDRANHIVLETFQIKILCNGG